MFKNFAFVLIILCWACSGRNSDKPEDALSTDKLEKIRMQAVKYMYFNESIPASDRFNPEYHPRYLKVLPSFTLSKLSIDNSGSGFFMMIREYGGRRFRATCGKVAIDENAAITEFQEIAVTPLLDKETAEQRGLFLFSMLTEAGTIEEKYLIMRSYVEWPDATTHYDEQLHQWVLKLN